MIATSTHPQVQGCYEIEYRSIAGCDIASVVFEMFERPQLCYVCGEARMNYEDHKNCDEITSQIDAWGDLQSKTYEERMAYHMYGWN